MFQVDCHALSDIGVGHHVSHGQFVVTDVPSPEAFGEATADSSGGNAADACDAATGRHLSKILGVADAVQGLPSGERASEIVASTARDFLSSNLQGRGEWAPEALNCTLTAVPSKCAEALSRDVAQYPWEKGLGSTLTLGHVLWPKLYLIHVGDCRCYLWRSGAVRQLTADQIADGTLTGSEIVSDLDTPIVRRRTLWSFIGDQAQNLSPQVVELDLQVGDALVFCTRGLLQGIDDQRMTDLLEKDLPAVAVCRRLVAAAHEWGESEDMTVIVARFREDAQP